MKGKLFCIFLVLTTFVFAQNNNLNIGETASKNYFEQFDFTFLKDKIIVPVEIEGVTYKFLLDTGAPNIISKEINDLLNPQLLRTISITDVSGIKEDLNVVSIEKLKFGNITFQNTATLVYDLKNNTPFNCLEVDGFIGSNMLRNSILQIDSKAMKITLTDNVKKLNLDRKNSSKLKLIGSQSSPYVWIHLGGKDKGKEHVLIDTGMGALYDISSRAYGVFKNEIIFNEVGESEGASSLGLFGDVPVKNHVRLHLPLLKINELEIENCITTTSNDTNSKIGAELLKYGVMTLDFRNKRFYFNPIAKKINIQKPEFNFTRTLKDGKLIVGFVWDDDLKEKLNYGDEILEINDEEIILCDLITKESALETEDSLKMRIKPNEGEIFEIKVEKKYVNIRTE